MILTFLEYLKEEYKGSYKSKCDTFYETVKKMVGGLFDIEYDKYAINRKIQQVEINLVSKKTPLTIELLTKINSLGKQLFGNEYEIKSMANVKAVSSLNNFKGFDSNIHTEMHILLQTFDPDTII